MNIHYPYDSIKQLNVSKLPLTGNIPYFQSNSNPHKIDLRHLANDKKVLNNPHKGWFWHYIDNGLKRPSYRVDHPTDDHLLDFPCLNHLYLRFDWGDIEKEEGHPDWSKIDQIMTDWGRYGYKFSIRICTYEGTSDIPFATPEYVYKAGAKGYLLQDGRLQPDYGDPVFLEKLSSFMELAGKKFNGDPRIELIDVGTFGTWGEGHTSYGDERVYSADVIRKHIDLHVNNFPDTFILLNDDHINSGWARGEDSNFSLIDYARHLKMGLQDDSVCVKGYVEPNGYNTLRTPWLFDLFWKTAPIVLEFEHYHVVSPEIFKGGFPFLEAIKRTHTTFAGFHGYPRPWLSREPYFTEYCANRLGYWYFINSIEISELKRNAKNLIHINIENRGFGLCYHNYTLQLVLYSENEKIFTQRIDANNVSWLPGKETCISLDFNPTNVPTGEFGFYLGLFEENIPIELGIHDSRRLDGLYHLCNVKIID